MHNQPMAEFGWLLNCCISEEPIDGSVMASAAILFASGVATSGITLYLAGLFHLI